MDVQVSILFISNYSFYNCSRIHRACLFDMSFTLGRIGTPLFNLNGFFLTLMTESTWWMSVEPNVPFGRYQNEVVRESISVYFRDGVKLQYKRQNHMTWWTINSQSVVKSNLAFERLFQSTFSREFVQSSKMPQRYKQDHEQETLGGKGCTEA